MKIEPDSHPATSPGLPEVVPDPEVAYSIGVIAGMAGMDSLTVLHYLEMGVIGTPPGGQDALFDEEALRRLRRIAHLREECGVNDSGIKLILTLMEELEGLREEQRRRRHV